MGDELLPPSFHPSILPATKSVKIFLKHALLEHKLELECEEPLNET